MTDKFNAESFKKLAAHKATKPVVAVTCTLALMGVGFEVGLYATQKMQPGDTPHVFQDSEGTIRIYPDENKAVLNTSRKSYMQVDYDRNYACMGVTLRFKKAADGSVSGINSMQSCRDISKGTSDNKLFIDAALKMRPYLDKVKAVKPI